MAIEQVRDDVERWTDESKKSIPFSVLKYAQRSIEMQPETAVNLPMYYDLWIRKGAFIGMIIKLQMHENMVERHYYARRSRRRAGI